MLMKIAWAVVGLVLLVIGAGMAAGGANLSAGANTAYQACINSQPMPPAGFCETFFAARSAYAALMYTGIVIAVIGLVLAAYGVVSPETLPLFPTASYPPAPALTAYPPCPVCAQPLSWISQYQRWYCARCAQYR